MSTRNDSGLCVHGLAGPCPDCPERRHHIGEVRGTHAATVLGREVRRFKPDGSLDWVTQHLTKWGARKAARRYEQTGIVKGHRP